MISIQVAIDRHGILAGVIRVLLDYDYPGLALVNRCGRYLTSGKPNRPGGGFRTRIEKGMSCKRDCDFWQAKGSLKAKYICPSKIRKRKKPGFLLLKPVWVYSPFSSHDIRVCHLSKGGTYPPGCGQSGILP
jgi:hypothetical protein